jgi:hypothetical protein
MRRAALALLGLAVFATGVRLGARMFRASAPAAAALCSHVR